MLDPVLQSPLADLGLPALARPMDASCGVWANEIANLGYISLRGNGADATFVAAAAKALDFALPVKPCTLAQSGFTRALWLSPDEWMIACPRAGHARLLAALGEQLKGQRHQVVDNSGGYTEVALLGPNAADVLSHTSVYDLAALEPGKVVGTTFGKASVYLHRDGDGFRLLLRRSFADYIWRYLERAAQPYGFGIALLEAKEGGGPP